MGTSLASSLSVSALQMALQNRQAAADVHHSDRGSQYTCGTYQALLQEHGIRVGMSRTVNCYDNAPMESFFSTLKVEWAHFQDYESRKEARTDIFAYIEGFYYRIRRHSSLGYLSLEEYERQYYASLS